MVSPKIPPDSKTFDEMISRLNSIGGEPRSGVLIRHLYIEYLMDWILRKKIVKPDKIITRSFTSKLELIESFEILSSDIMHELKIVNDVRNQFAHNIDIDSVDFQNNFSKMVHQMLYYKDNAIRFEKIDTRYVYNMITMRVYAVLKYEYDQLQPLSKSNS